MRGTSNLPILTYPQMPLSDAKIRAAKPKDKPYKLSDEKGLYLQIHPNGSKYWRHKYRFNGKENVASYGVYPEVSLAVAREQRDNSRKLLRTNVDPNRTKQAEKATKALMSANSFEAVAREWFANKSNTWVESHGNRIIRRLEKNFFPWIGKDPIADIEPPILLQQLRRIEGRGVHETAHRALQNLKSIYVYAIATGRATRNPAADIEGALAPTKGNHFAAVTDPKELGDLLRVLDGHKGTFVVSCALKLCPLVFVRPGELRKARWSDIDLENETWSFKASKTQQAHIVPLAKQSIEILNELKSLTGGNEYVFSGGRDPKRPMSENAVLAALRSLGIPKEKMTGHGFRATARTLLEEELGYPKHIIEHQLAHAVKDANGAAYNRTTMLPERRKMMTQWADYLDNLRVGGNIVPFVRKQLGIQKNS